MLGIYSFTSRFNFCAQTIESKEGDALRANLSLAFYSVHTCRTAGDNINIYGNQRPRWIYRTFKIHFPHLMPLSDFHSSFFLSPAFYISYTLKC